MSSIGFALRMEILAPLRSPMRVYMVRLGKDVPRTLAESRITEAARSVSSPPAGWGGVRLEPVHARYVAAVRPALLAITTAASLVLVIVSANVAVLMLLRATQRQKEMSVRVALGASRADVFRIVFGEMFLVCTAALIAGALTAEFALRALGPLIEEHLGRPAPGGTSAMAVDSTVLLAVGLLGVVITLTLSSIPLLGPLGSGIADTLRRDSRTASDSLSVRRMRSALIAFEVAGALALLVGCGLMIRSAVNLLRADLGFHTGNIIRARLALPMRKYPGAQSLATFYERFLERLSVSNTTAALTNWPPFYQTPLQSVEIENGAGAGLEAGVIAVSPAYFSILGIDIVRGRPFTANDRVGAEPVAIVSESLAHRLWPDGNALGRRIRTGEQPAARSPLGSWRTIVGIVRDVRQTYTDEDLKETYIPFLQSPNQYAPVFIQSNRPASFWLSRLRATIGEMDREVLVSGVNSLKDEGERFVAGARFLASILSGFALFAALLAVLGIYGATAYTVAERQREVAIRIAVGASRSAITRMFIKEAGVVVAFGIAGGILGARAITGILANQLYGVQSSDYSTLVSMSALIASVGLFAAWRPARRAGLRNPAEALKET